MQVTITPERPDTADSLALIDELEAYLTPLYPAESQFGFSPEKLIRENVAFFVLRYKDSPAACGAVKLFDDFGEIKRMYVRPEYRGKGFGRLMLSHLEEYARQHDIRMLRLETGVNQPEALRLYEGMGYYKISSFDPYPKDLPLSLFYEKRLNP